MSTVELAYLVMVLAGFGVFVLVLGGYWIHFYVDAAKDAVRAPKAAPDQA